jgi:hypothetical protein
LSARSVSERVYRSKRRRIVVIGPVRYSAQLLAIGKRIHRSTTPRTQIAVLMRQCCESGEVRAEAVCSSGSHADESALGLQVRATIEARTT